MNLKNCADCILQGTDGVNQPRPHLAFPIHQNNLFLRHLRRPKQRRLLTLLSIPRHLMRQCMNDRFLMSVTLHLNQLNQLHRAHIILVFTITRLKH